MIEICSVVSCIDEDEYSLDIINKYKEITYLSKEVVIENKINNNNINNNINNNNINSKKKATIDININNSKKIYEIIKQKIKKKNLNKPSYVYNLNVLEKKFELRECKIKKYRKNKEKIKKKIIKKNKRYEKIMNLMNNKLSKLCYLKHNKNVTL